VLEECLATNLIVNNWELIYRKAVTSPETMVLEAFVDASYMEEDGLLTSTTGLCIFLNGHLIH
jgi:hypothetical protein